MTRDSRRPVTTYDLVIDHSRRAPLHNRFRYRTRCWLVDLEELPRLPRGLRWLARFDPRDHIGDPARSLRDNLAAVLAAESIDVSGGRILMLANARALGHVFNPLTLHWCYDAEGCLIAVVAEVHNTYHGRHAYVLRPDANGRVDVRLAKQMYVSPFNPVDGGYRITVSEPRERLDVAVSLERRGQPPFVATLRGRRLPAAGPVGTALRTATTSLRVSALIRWHGIVLVLRGLRVQPRPNQPASPRELSVVSR
jgi:uncharacterized protein